MKSYTRLPEGYKPVMEIDLQKDKKLALLVNGLALAVMVVMAAAAACFVPLSTLFADVAREDGHIRLMLKMLALCVGSILYIVLHEAVHGIAMRCFSEAKVRFGFTGLYAFAGSDAFYCRRHYVIIALAPIAVWGIILGIVNFLVPISWFYVVYFIQICNISGAAGDLYVSWRMRKLPDDILVRDTGVSMTVFSRD